MRLEVGIALRCIRANNDDLFHYIMTAKTLTPEFDMDLAPATRFYNTLGKGGICAAARRPGLLNMEILVPDIGKPKVIYHRISFVHFAKVYSIHVKFDNAR